MWPVRGRVVSAFGDKPDGRRNDGVNIEAPAGTPVLAADNGVVVYAGSAISGFGNMLLLKHSQGLITAYAHVASLDVHVGDVVRRGQRVATVGSSGDVRSPQLHFELRNGQKAVDPFTRLSDSDLLMAGG